MGALRQAPRAIALHARALPCLLVLLVPLVVAWPRQASAAPAAAPGTRWYVETVGTACADQRVALENEITLACGAVSSTCGVAPSPADAELRAVLDCSATDESWTLVTRTKGGIVLNRLDLTGPRPDRLREAAVEVARDVAPEHAAAVETLRFSLVGEQPARVKITPETLTLVFGARATSETSPGSANDGSGGGSGGGHLLAGLAIGRSVRATLGGVGEAGGRSAMRGGLGVALGAPFDGTSWIGIAAEVGVGSTTRYVSASDYFTGSLRRETPLAGYAQGTFTFQLPLQPVRPYAALAATALTDTLILASVEAGIALPIF